MAVKLAESGTPMRDFQKERTKAFDKMINNPDEFGIYPTTKFFERLDKAAIEFMKGKHKDIKLAVREAIEECSDWKNMQKTTWWEVEDTIKSKISDAILGDSD